MRLKLLLSTALLMASPLIADARDTGVPLAESSSATEAGPIGGRFILVDQYGKAVLDEEYRGSFLLVTFGYTHCPDICPTTLQAIAGALDTLGPDAAGIRPIFITLDPLRDTSAVLKEYMASFGPRFVGLTGPEANIADAAAKFRIKYAKAGSESLGYTIDHTGGIFLMAPDGRFLERFPHDMAPQILAARLRDRLKAAK